MKFQMKKLLLIVITLLVTVLTSAFYEVYASNDGLVNQEGTWYYIENGNKSNYTGLTQYNGTWYYVQNGKITWGINTLVQHNGTWYYIENSQITWGKNTLFQYNGTWYYIENSQITWGKNTLFQYNGTWYYIENSQITWGKNTLFQYNGTWYAIRNSQINWDFEGMVPYNHTVYYLKNAKLTWGQNGVVSVDNKLYYLKNTEWYKKYSGFETYNKELFYLKDGLADWTYTNLSVHVYQNKYYIIQKNRAFLKGSETRTVVEETVDQFKTVRIEDETLEKGVEKETVKGVNGLIKKTYIVTYENGQQISKVLQKTDTTKRVDRVLRVGIKETKVERRVTVTNFQKTTTYSDDVPRGETEFTKQGQNGEVEDTYTVVYIKGVKKSEVKTSSKQLKAVVNQIEVIGSGIPTYTKKWQQQSYVPVKETDKSKDTLAEIKRLGINTGHVFYVMNWANKEITPVYSVEEMNEILVKYMDRQKFNVEFLKLVNAHRQAQGPASFGSGIVKERLPLKLEQVAIKAAMIRSQEQANIGDLRTDGQPHVRPNGTSWQTVANELPELSNTRMYLSGENILAQGDILAYTALNEAELAKVTFEQWKSSPPHNANMLSVSHKGIGVGFGLTKTKIKGYPFIATTIFTSGY